MNERGALMISNQILLNTVEGIKGITKADMCVLDIEGKVLASTMASVEGCISAVKSFIASPADSQVVQEYQFFKVYDDIQLEYILVVQGSSEDIYMLGKIASFQIQNLIIAYKERFDKDNFVKNLILDNLLLVDIYNRAKKLNIKTDSKRVIYIIEASLEVCSNILFQSDISILEKNVDFITAVDEKNSIVVKMLKESEDAQSVSNYAEVFLQELESHDVKNSKISYGTIVSDIKEVSKSYKEARMALDIGKIFFEQQQIIPYSGLGIGRLIYQLPMPLCKMFITEIFGDSSPDEFDLDTLTTIDKFFENNLNVSETSRQLYIHRNTLVYRLDKLQKVTGLDLRAFQDAITFKIALMVVKYMKYMETMRY